MGLHHLSFRFLRRFRIVSTFGRVSRAGAMALSYSMDKIGPMCRTAEDCDAVLRAISGHDPQDAGSLPDVLPDTPAYRDTESAFGHAPAFGMDGQSVEGNFS